MKLSENEKIEDLGCRDLKIIQNRELYTFTSDSVILANFLKIKKNEVAVEIGVGCGIVSILSSAKNEFKQIYGFEQDEELFKLAQKNLEINNLNEKITFFHEKVQNFSKLLKNQKIDVVFSNPPYMKTFDGKKDVRYYARHDDLLKIDELCKAASQMLCDGGRFYVVYSSERCAELIASLIKHNLQPKTMFFTDNGRGRVVLVVLECVKGGKSGVKVLPNLSTNEQDGKFYERLNTRNFL